MMTTRASILGVVLFACAQCAQAQGSRPAEVAPDLTGVYRSIPNGSTISGGLKNSGSPSEMALLPSAVEQVKKVNPKDDPWRTCQPVGPFRMMAREQTKIELAPATGIVVMLFEDIAHGVIRTIYLRRAHPEHPVPTWLGDSVGHWEGDTLVVDTVGFNTRTWLNDAGAPHSEALHLVERIKPIRGGQFLEYKVTADDPVTLAKPYTYTRYYEKLSAEIADDVCHDE